MADDMTVTVNGTHYLAERACRMVFGEDTSAGPVCACPAPLLQLLADWPKDMTDQPMRLALELPYRFDIERELGKYEAKAVVLIACRITVLHRGRKVGYALRTNQPGLNAIQLWERAWAQHKRRLAH